MLSLREFDEKVNSLSITTRDVQDVINDTITLRFQDPLSASRYLPVFAKYFLFKQDRKIVKPLFYLCDGFKLYDDEQIQRYVYYTYFLVYYVIPSYPKAIEYGLELEQLGFNYPYMELNTYNYMSIMCLSLKILDEAVRYNRKGIETAKKFFDPDSDIYRKLLFVYYNNLLLINTYNNNYFSASIICEKINEYVSTNSDDDFTRQLKNYVSFSLMQYHKTFENEFDADEYIKLMNQLKENPEHFCPLEISVDEHLPLIMLLKEQQRSNEAIEICRFILQCPKFIGDKTLVQTELFNLYDLDTIESDPKAIKKFVREYRNLVRDFTDNRFYMNNVIAMEEFKIHSMRNNMLKIADQYARDALTNCYMRYTFENDFKDFYSKLDDGALVFLDLDNLKYVNDSLGHESGDIYIKRFVDYVKKELSMREHLYRYGGDEFIILTDKSKEAIEPMLAELQAGSEYKDQPSFSYGVASLKDDSKELQEALKIADERMYEQKKARRSLRLE